MKNYAPQETKAPKRLESKIENGSIFVNIVCPNAVGCIVKKERNCKYVAGHDERYSEPKFPPGEAIITALDCAAVFTLGRDNKGFYIESEDILTMR